jgi:hypothetical protein
MERKQKQQNIASGGHGSKPQASIVMPNDNPTTQPPMESKSKGPTLMLFFISNNVSLTLLIVNFIQ